MISKSQIRATIHRIHSVKADPRMLKEFFDSFLRSYTTMTTKGEGVAIAEFRDSPASVLKTLTEQYGAPKKTPASAYGTHYLWKLPQGFIELFSDQRAVRLMDRQPENITDQSVIRRLKPINMRIRGRNALTDGPTLGALVTPIMSGKATAKDVFWATAVDDTRKSVVQQLAQWSTNPNPMRIVSAQVFLDRAVAMRPKFVKEGISAFKSAAKQFEQYVAKNGEKVWAEFERKKPSYMDQRVYDQWIKLGYESALRSSWVGELGGVLDAEGLANLVTGTPSGGALFDRLQDSLSDVISPGEWRHTYKFRGTTR